MLMSQALMMLAMCASTPFASVCRMTTLWNSPVKRTSTPLMRVMTAAPPPMLSPRTDTCAPVSSVTSMSTVLGWSTWSAARGVNVKASPAACAQSNESRMRSSSGAMPSMPATSALSVP